MSRNARARVRADGSQACWHCSVCYPENRRLMNNGLIFLDAHSHAHTQASWKIKISASCRHGDRDIRGKNSENEAVIATPVLFWVLFFSTKHRFSWGFLLNPPPQHTHADAHLLLSPILPKTSGEMLISRVSSWLRFAALRTSKKTKKKVTHLLRFKCPCE